LQMDAQASEQFGKKDVGWGLKIRQMFLYFPDQIKSKVVGPGVG